jgi:hypothetical protein
MRWIALLLAAAVIASCFFPWVSYEGGNVVEGFHSTNDRWGRPGLMHTLFCSIFILLILAGKLWSMRIAFFVSTFNIAWAVRNFFMIPACEAGVCPEKHTALYVLLIGSTLAMVALLFSGAEDRNITSLPSSGQVKIEE